MGGQTGTPLDDTCKIDPHIIDHLTGFAGSYVGTVTVHGSARISEGSVSTTRLTLTAFREQIRPLGSSCSAVTVSALLAMHTDGANGINLALHGQLAKQGTGAELMIEDDQAYGTLSLFDDETASLAVEVGDEMFTASRLERE